MRITYYWEDVIVNRIMDRGFEPHTKAHREDVEYEFEITPTQEDIDDFNSQNFENITEDDIYDNDDFYDFMKERYEEKAKQEFERGNEEL